jgi:hypothetical protein
MRFLSVFFTIIFCSIFNAQNIGLVSDINPQMGYTNAKDGVIFLNPVLEKDLDFNILDFTIDTLKKNNKLIKLYNEFNWNGFEVFDDFRTRYKKLKYLKSYCESKNIQELFIIRKSTSKQIFNSYKMFDKLQHNFGILTVNSAKKNVYLYSNFHVYKYSAKSEKIYIANLDEADDLNVYINKKYDEKYDKFSKLLPNNIAIDYFSTYFKNYYSKTLLQLLNQKDN